MSVIFKFLYLPFFRLTSIGQINYNTIENIYKRIFKINKDFLSHIYEGMKYYFLGIGGVSMSALAVLLKSEGGYVCGYDEKDSRGVEILKENKIEVDFEFRKERFDWADVIVYSSAIKSDNPLFEYAKKTKKRLMCRGQLLEKISSQYEKVIAVAGAHGKTTVTSMIFEVLKVAGKNPTLHLGGYKLDGGKNYSLGEKEFFVTEACEYCDNFLYLHPYLSIVTNIEKEHLDYFKTFENELESFKQFKAQSRFVIDSASDICAKNLRHDKMGRLCFGLWKEKTKIMNLKLKVCEDVNAQNCIFTYKACKLLGIDDCLIKQGLENYQGVQLRFQKATSPFFDNVICDYAHHPTEISKAIASAKKIYKNKKLIVVFQPHTYSRTKMLQNEFLQVFKDEYLPILYKTYAARERPEEGVGAKEFGKKLKKINKNAKYFENFELLRAFLQKYDKNKTVLLFVGAGDLPEVLHKNNFIS